MMRILSFSLKITLLALIPILAFNGCKDDDPTTATISGTITFENVDLWETWQDSGEVQVTLFPEFVLALPPQGQGWGDIPPNFFGPGVPGGRFALGAPDYTTTLTFVPGQSQYEFSFEVLPGTYSALAVGFRHDLIADPSLRSATLGVYWDNPNEVSHGIVIDPFFNYPAPSEITVTAGDELDLDFRADFDFVNLWFQ